MKVSFLLPLTELRGNHRQGWFSVSVLWGKQQSLRNSLSWVPGLLRGNECCGDELEETEKVVGEGY